MLLLWATSFACVRHSSNQHTKAEHRRKRLSVQTSEQCQKKHRQNEQRLWWKQHCSGFGSFAFFTSLSKFRHSALLIFVRRKTSKSNTYRKLLEFSWELCEEEEEVKKLGTIMKSHSFLHSKTESEIFGSIFVDFSKFLFFQRNSFFFIAGLLSAVHPTENPVPPMHKEPAMHDPAGESQSLPVLSAKKVHRRWNESGW